MPRTLLASVLLVAATAVSAAADVPANASYQVRLELGDGHGAAAFDGTIAMTGDHACGKLETTTGPTRYTARVCREGGDAANPVISVDLDRATRVDHDMRHQKMEITARIAAGTRAVIGRIGDGKTTTELAVTVR
jgi:hypothetical protein